MSKITQYLNEHLLGEATSNEKVKERFSTDGSILRIVPEVVASPRTTNDIRKIARFAWQLAEKGHVLPITTRGYGSDISGASIGKGIIIDMTTHLSKILYVGLKSKDLFAHVQPGVNFQDLNEALKSHGLIVSAYPYNQSAVSVGGAIANNLAGPLSGEVGNVGDYVKKLEVVLANGDVLETSRISRRELSKKKGLQTFEGEIYRKLDGLIEDNQSLIKEIKEREIKDNTGYSGIANVKQKDGSFDLTPLFFGSQGTLGIISEAVLKLDYYEEEKVVVVAAFSDHRQAQDGAALIMKLKPYKMEMISNGMFDVAQKHGKKYTFVKESPELTGAVLVIEYNDDRKGVRKKKLKQTLKKLVQFDTEIITSEDHSIEELEAISGVTSVILHPEEKGESYNLSLVGSALAVNSRDNFINDLDTLAAKHHTSIPFCIDWLSGAIFPYFSQKLHSVGDKQKAFKIIDDYMELVAKYGGSLNYATSEGRLKAASSYANISDGLNVMYGEVRKIFDPFMTLNPGVKQANEVKNLVGHLKSE